VFHEQDLHRDLQGLIDYHYRSRTDVGLPKDKTGPYLSAPVGRGQYAAENSLHGSAARDSLYEDLQSTWEVRGDFVAPEPFGPITI
jgi:hypothetical protein